MTFEEARKILDEENCFCIINVVKPLEVIELLPWEKTEVNEAIATMGEYGYRASYVRMADTENRLKKLKAKYDKAHPAKKNDTRKDYEKVSQIVDKLIEEEGEPINGEHLNPALRDAAKEFDDALLDEQTKKIKKLEATIENREKEIDILNDTMARRIKDIQDLKQTVKSDNAIIEQYEKKVKELGKQIAHLNEVIGKKNAQLKDYKIACEEHDEQLKDYMLSDKNKDDMISGLKKLNEGLRHKLAEATVNKVNEQALKSAESALVYKDGVIDKQKKELKKRREKVEELSKKLEATEKARKEYFDFGIGANNFIKKICSAYVEAHDKKTFDIGMYFESKHGMYGLSPKTAFEYAKERNTYDKKKIFTGVDLGSDDGDKKAKIIISKYASFDHDGFMRFVDDLKDFMENGRTE